MDKKITRRTVILRCLQLPLGGSVLLGLAACGSGSDSSTSMLCADPSKMDRAQQSVRRTLNYVEKSPDAAKTCIDCDFFTAGTETGGCGTCEMFNGEPANPGGHCDSWSLDAYA